MQSSYGVITGSLHGETKKYPRGEKTSLTWTRNKTSEESNVKSEETFLSSVGNLFFSHTYLENSHVEKIEEHDSLHHWQRRAFPVTTV